MLSHLIRRKCPSCSRFSSRLKEFIRRLFRFGVDCQGIHQRTYDSQGERAAKINTAAPDCACENYRMSSHSPCPVESSELLARFVFPPMHVDKRTGAVKPSFFSHVFANGCSIQRDSIATVTELANVVSDVLRTQTKFSWKGALLASCHDVRNITTQDTSNRAICVYDTAETDNPAHSEMVQTQYVIEETDRAEISEKLMSLFNNGTIVRPTQFRNGAVWNLLTEEHRAR